MGKHPGKYGMNHHDRDKTYHLAGWVLFLACALLFFCAALKDGDFILALASLVFLAGCIMFLIPLLFPGAVRGTETGFDGENPSR
jgi:hypothetical protein